MVSLLIPCVAARSARLSPGWRTTSYHPDGTGQVVAGKEVALGAIVGMGGAGVSGKDGVCSMVAAVAVAGTTVISGTVGNPSLKASESAPVTIMSDTRAVKSPVNKVAIVLIKPQRAGGYRCPSMVNVPGKLWIFPVHSPR